MMKQIKDKILTCLKDLKGSGKFASIHTADFVFPGLEVEGVGDIAFPVREAQARDLIQSAHKAPFGKGSQTILDNSVRSAWEIDADQLSISNPAWTKFLNKAISKIKVDLGLEDYTIAAHLYKLLIYEEGDFFLPHKDTEKEKGMFGTLIIGLPSRYTGGELVIHFDGASEVADFSENTDKYAINYAAFYADCDHEVKPLTSGYRVCLVYNLVQKKSAKKIELQSVQSYAANLAEIFTTHHAQNPSLPYIILLGHQYTPENFSPDSLKLNDRSKAEALLLAAKNAGYYAKMCLVTSYRMGIPDDDGYYGYGNDRGNDDAEMIEVIEESIDIEHWLENELPALSNVQIDEDDLITSFALNDDEPIVKESTGFMGNYGPDLMHWYHYGAVMIWSPQVNAMLLLSQHATTQLNWIDYFNQKKQITELEAAAVETILSTGINTSRYTDEKANFNAIAEWFINQKNNTVLLQLHTPQLQLYFNQIDVEHWIKVFKFLPKDITAKVFAKVTVDITLPVLEKLLAVLRALAAHDELRSLGTDQMIQQPDYFKAAYSKTTDRIKSSALDDLFWLVKNLSPTESWVKEMVEIITMNPQRGYIHKILTPCLLKTKDHSELTEKLFQFCREYLQHKVNNQPQPPADWSRPLPLTTANQKEWQLLKDFLESPYEQVFDYRKNQNERKMMEYAIKSVVIIDLEMKTVKTGSPHTLRITKTQAAFQRQMKEWHEDVALLDKLPTKR